LLDLLIRGGTLVDGTGAPPYCADLGVQDGRIVEIGAITQTARETVDASGAWVTPGFVDIHTHYDGQATWDATFSPSIHYGVTTVVMGNCGVGFAPLQPGSEDRLIKLMEGVEDIPGAALKEGVRFAWDSFGEYLNALDAMPHSLDYLAMVTHDPLRMRVMGARAEAREAATAGDIAAMCELLGAALDAGAAGFSTGRSDNHRTAEALDTPASIASATELCGLAQAFAGRQHGVVQVVSDFDLMQGINGLDASFHPFMGFPGYKEIASLSIAEQAAAMRVPAPKARLQRAGGAVRPLQRRRRQRPGVLSDLQLQPGLARRRAPDADAPARPFWPGRCWCPCGHHLRRQLQHLHAQPLGTGPRP